MLRLVVVAATVCMCFFFTVFAHVEYLRYLSISHGLCFNEMKKENLKEEERGGRHREQESQKMNGLAIALIREPSVLFCILHRLSVMVCT